jgi:hypothetical protein
MLFLLAYYHNPSMYGTSNLFARKPQDSSSSNRGFATGGNQSSGYSGQVERVGTYRLNGYNEF